MSGAETTFRDREGREIELRLAEPDGGGPRREAVREALLEMYRDFGPEDRAQGVPPGGEAAIRQWLDSLEQPLEVVAWDDERAAAHAFLVPMNGRHELGVFVHPGYRRARIGARILERLLAEGQSRGVSRVWLSVGRGNDAARYLYRRAGFRVVESAPHELEMVREL